MDDPHYDLIIIGASFAGLAMAHHIPPDLKVLVLDRKSSLDQGVESTGLITEKTRQLFASFTDIDRFIPNRITTIGVMAPDFEQCFFSSTENPWINSTDTPELIKHISLTLPTHIDLKIKSSFKGYSIRSDESYPVKAVYTQNGKGQSASARFIIGADGSHSTVAKNNPRLSKNRRFLGAMEKVFFGEILLGPHPDSTVYHFWFGEFSLGYGGWLSPTIIQGKKAFRLGLAKLEKDIGDIHKIEAFIKILLERKIIRIEGGTKEIFQFGHPIPMGGPLRRVHDSHSMLIGDAAGLCGAFAADGIKGALVSGKVAAELISEYLGGDRKALQRFYPEIQMHNRLMTYYRKQLFYRFVWDRMKSDRSFNALYHLIERSKEGFLNQFCDSKDKNKSLMRVVLKWRNLPALAYYALTLFLDFFKIQKRSH